MQEPKRSKGDWRPRMGECSIPRPASQPSSLHCPKLCNRITGKYGELISLELPDLQEIDYRKSFERIVLVYLQRTGKLGVGDLLVQRT